MPINCFALSGGEIAAQTPVEPGTVNTYHLRPDKIGGVILAACHQLDRGGRIYFTDEDKLPDWKVGPNNYSIDMLENQDHITLQSGTSLPVPILRDGEVDFILLFNHCSPN